MFEWLKLYRELDIEQQALEIKKDICVEEIDRWQTINDTHVDLGKKHDFLSRVRQIDRIREDLNELNDRLQKIEDKKNRVIKLIDKFDGVENKILKKKYIIGMTLKEIAYDLGYSEQYIRRKHAECIKRIEFNK